MKSIGPIMIALKTMFFIALMCFIPSMAKAQKKQKARIKLEYHNIDGVKILKAKVVSKVGRVYVAVPDVPVHFFINEEIEENKLSQAITDKEGMVKITLDATLIMSADSTYIFYASIMDNPVYKDKSKDIEIKDVNYSLECAVIDSVKVATINLKDLENKPVADVMVKLYVKRLFGLLPIGDDYLTTNKKGALKIEFPNDIPGDENGTIELIAKIEDNDDFGNLEIHQQIKWGTLLTMSSNKNTRELWADRDNAPIYLIVTTNSIIISIWLVIFYIVYQLFILKKLGKRST